MLGYRAWGRSRFGARYSVGTGHPALLLREGRIGPCSYSQIRVVRQPICLMQLAAAQSGVVLETADGASHAADAVYPMVGGAPRIQLLARLDVHTDGSNMLWVDEHQQTSIPGLYAAGDVVHALNQMSVGVAHAATAATVIHNRLPRNYR